MQDIWASLFFNVYYQATKYLSLRQEDEVVKQKSNMLDLAIVRNEVIYF